MIAGLMVRRSRGLRKVHGDCAAMFGFPPLRPSLGRRIQPRMPPVGAPAANPSRGRSGQEEDKTGQSEVDRQPESADLGMLEARQAEARAEALAGKRDAFFVRPGKKAASTLTWMGLLAILVGYRRVPGSHGGACGRRAWCIRTASMRRGPAFKRCGPAHSRQRVGMA